MKHRKRGVTAESPAAHNRRCERCRQLFYCRIDIADDSQQTLRVTAGSKQLIER